MWRIHNRDGVDRCLLDSSLRSPGKSGIRGQAGGSSTAQESSRAKDRHSGLPVDSAASHLWALSGAFRPDEQICTLRGYVRQRAMLVEYASHHIQHMHKALEQMNIKLKRVITEVTGITGMRIIRSILDGERDPVNSRRCATADARTTKRRSPSLSKAHGDRSICLR